MWPCAMKAHSSSSEEEGNRVSVYQHEIEADRVIKADGTENL